MFEPMDELDRYDEPVEVISHPEPYCWCFEPERAAETPDDEPVCLYCGRIINPMDRDDDAHCIDCGADIDPTRCSTCGSYSHRQRTCPLR